MISRSSSQTGDACRSNSEVGHFFRALPQEPFFGGRPVPEHLPSVRDHHVRRNHGQVLVHLFGVRDRRRGNARAEQPVEVSERGPQERRRDGRHRRPEPRDASQPPADGQRLPFGVRLPVPTPQAPHGPPTHAQVLAGGRRARSRPASARFKRRRTCQ